MSSPLATGVVIAAAVASMMAVFILVIMVASSLAMATRLRMLQWRDDVFALNRIVIELD